MPRVLTIASQGWNCQAPSSVMNSPTKLFSIGSPRAASVTTMKTPARTGIRGARSLIAERSYVPVRAAIQPISRNSAAMMIPWLTICSTAPCWPCWLKAKMPSTMKPMWLTLEYAISSFMSRCASAIRAPQTMPATADQGQQRAGQRVEDELQRGAPGLAALPPLPEQEVGGDQLRLPEDVEQQQVRGQEHPGHAALQQQEQRDEAALADDAVARGDDRDDRQAG